MTTERDGNVTPIELNELAKYRMSQPNIECFHRTE